VFEQLSSAFGDRVRPVQGTYEQPLSMRTAWIKLALKVLMCLLIWRALYMKIHHSMIVHWYYALQWCN